MSCAEENCDAAQLHRVCARAGIPVRPAGVLGCNNAAAVRGYVFRLALLRSIDVYYLFGLLDETA